MLMQRSAISGDLCHKHNTFTSALTYEYILLVRFSSGLTLILLSNLDICHVLNLFYLKCLGLLTIN